MPQTEVNKTPATPAPAVAAAPAPKFVITGDTLEALAVDFARAAIASGRVTVQDSKAKEPKKYGIWTLDDGTSTNPFNKQLTLSPEQAIALETSAGVPQLLSMEVVMRQLVPKAQLPMAIAARGASKAATIERLKAQIDQSKLIVAAHEKQIR